jgi:hypothetical protein
MYKLDKMEGLDLEVSGTMSNTDCALTHEEDARLLEDIWNSKAGKGKGSTINWPAFSESPISKYGGKWYSVYCFHGCIPVVMVISIIIELSILASQQLFLADGRFAKDRTWCFYALNHAEHRRSTTHGQWFVNNLLHSEEILCIDTLKEKLKNNDTKSIEKLQYFAQCVQGSYSYWRNKRADLISWIGHHVEQRNGSPSLFVTLSCAESTIGKILRNY